MENNIILHTFVLLLKNEFSAGIPEISNAEIFSLLLFHVLACSNYA